MPNLELVLSDELAIRRQRAIDRRLKQAQFREMKTLDQLDFSFNPTLPKRRIMDLATGQFIREAADILLLGPPGTGKSHCCQAVGRSAIKAGFTVLYRSIFDVVRDFLHEAAFEGDDKTLMRYLKPDLLIIDDMGMKQLPKRSGECLFEIILRRHEVRSTMMTSNRPLQDWGKLIGDVPAATAILDRFLEHAEIIQITGQSYRLRNRTKEKLDQEDKAQQDAKTGQDEKPRRDAKTGQKETGNQSPKTGQSAHRVEPEESSEKNCPENKQAKRQRIRKTHLRLEPPRSSIR